MNDRETVVELRRKLGELTAKLAAAMGALAAQWAEEPRRGGSTGSGPSDFGTHVIATGVHAYCSACGARTEPGATMAQWAKIPHKSTCPWKIAQDALADITPASKRYRAIVAAAEALEAFASGKTPAPRKAEDVEMDRMKEFTRLLSALYDAVRMAKGE